MASQSARSPKRLWLKVSKLAGLNLDTDFKHTRRQDKRNNNEYKKYNYEKFD